MTRRVLPLLCLALALTACGKNNKSSASTTTAPPTTTTTAPPPTTPVAPPAGLSLVVSLQHPTVARDEPVEGFLTATNTTPKGTPDLHLTFPGKCDVGLLLYSQGKVVAHSDGACTTDNTEYDMRAGETRISGFGNLLLTPSGVPPAAGTYDLGVLFLTSAGAYQAPLVKVTLT